MSKTKNPILQLYLYSVEKNVAGTAANKCLFADSPVPGGMGW